MVPRSSATSAPVAANAAAARSCHEHAPPPATWRRPSSRCSAICTSAGEVARERRAADLVVDHRQRVALAREAEHRGDEVPAVRPNSHDVRTIAWRRRRAATAASPASLERP